MDANLNLNLGVFLNRFCDIIYWDKKKQKEISLKWVKLIVIETEFLLIQEFRKLDNGESFVIEAHPDSLSFADDSSVIENNNYVWSVKRIFLNGIREIQHSTNKKKHGEQK